MSETGGVLDGGLAESASLEPKVAQPMDRPLLQDDDGAPSDSRRNLTTFFGVFCPVTLAMFSTALFLRTGMILGQAGLLLGLVELTLAYTILTLTTLSICAISTNGAIASGGAYYMISRTLGPQFGGALGVLFFIANVVSCALYISATVEVVISAFGTDGAFGDVVPSTGWGWIYLYSSLLLFMSGTICILGGSMFARASGVFLAIVLIAIISVIVSTFVEKEKGVLIPSTNWIIYPNQNGSDPKRYFFYTGYNYTTLQENTFPHWQQDYKSSPGSAVQTFGSTFAVLYASVTGIMNGANMSGELKRPSFAIPVGTLSAIAFTYFTYVLMFCLSASTASNQLLVNNYNYLTAVNVWNGFVLIGSFVVTISAATGNLIGASRYLEALADDEIFWNWLRLCRIKYNGNPWVAVLISWFLVQLLSMIQAMNTIAAVTTVFYLIMYAGTNLACLTLDLASAPNFRPSFVYFSWHTCTLGFIACLAVAFVVSAMFAAVGLLLLLSIIILLQFRQFPSQWGSISQAIIFHQVRKYLLMLDSRKDHVRYWRPQILLMVANPRCCPELMLFCNDFKKSGLYVLGHVIVDDLDHHQSDPVSQQLSHWMDAVDLLNIKAFVEITMAATVRQGLQHLSRISGLGGMKPNTIVFGFYDEENARDTLCLVSPKKRVLPIGERPISGMVLQEHFPGPRGDDKAMSADEYVSMINDMLKMNKNIVLCRNFIKYNKEELLSGPTPASIDVWPVNPFKMHRCDDPFDTSSMFVLQMACVLHMVRNWRRKSVMRFFLLSAEATSQLACENEQRLKVILTQLRIIGQVMTVSWSGARLNLDAAAPEDDGGITSSQHSDRFFPVVQDDDLKGLRDLVHSHCSPQSIVFMNLPAPPHETNRYERYLEQVSTISHDLPPTVLVHGLHLVTSTTL